MILIVSFPGDAHAQAVAQALQARGATPMLLDLSRFPGQCQVELGYGTARRGEMWLRDAGWGDIDLRRCRAAWWRRPQPFGIPPEVTDNTHRAFAANEAREVFGGLWKLMDAVWVNDPQRDDLAHRKSYQLRAAEAVGLAVPETLITNAPEAARGFIARHGAARTVFKAFNGTRQAWRETRLVGEEELARLDLVRIAPVIFQGYVDGVDIRVTAIGDRLFPAEIDITDGDYAVDFRMNYDRMRIRPARLPADVEAKIRALMAHLGLVYGAIDLRRTSEGYVFLEINPAGQWLFIEQQTRQPITDALAGALAAFGGER
jgi:glutathione synthase/RimK-type ligase-like ATP-grasp enzyme